MTITSGNPTRIKLSGGDDVLGIVPYLLGFHPEESVVALVFDRGHLEMAARFDLAAMAHPWSVEQNIGHLLVRLVSPTVVLVGYGRETEKVHDALDCIETYVGREVVVDSVVVSQGRWWSRMCFADCCPPEGTPVSEASAAAAAAVVAGCSALESRRELEESVSGPHEWNQTMLQRKFTKRAELWADKTLDERLAEADKVLARGMKTHLSERACVDLAVLVTDIEVRDALWLQMTRADADKHLSVWKQVVAVAIDSHATPPLCLLAAASWLAGNGALMVCCLSRAWLIDPDYSMLHLLDQVQRNAAPPSVWDDMSLALKG